MAITTTGTLPAAVQQSFAMKLLSVPTPNFIHKIPAIKDSLQRNGGPIKRYRRYNALNSALVPLGNSGVTPPSQNLTAVDIDARIDYYGTWVEINEQVVLQNQESVLNEAALRLGVSLRQTEDELTSRMLAATAAQVNAVNGVNGDNPTQLTREDVDGVVRTLLGNDGKMFLSSIEGEDRFGTAPVRNAYFALAHTDMSSELQNVNGFIHQTEYPNQQRVLDSEWGAAGNLRFLISSIGSQNLNSSSLGATVFNIFCVAQEAFACIEQDGYTTQFIYRPAQYSGPLAQNVTVGYKFAEVPRILNDAWVLNLRCTLA